MDDREPPKFKPRQRHEYVVPSDAQIETDGGYFGPDGMWVPDPHLRARAQKRNAAKRTQKYTKAHFAAWAAAGRAAITPDGLRRQRAALARWREKQTPEDFSTAMARARNGLSQERIQDNLVRGRKTQRGTAKKCNNLGVAGVYLVDDRYYASIYVSGRLKHLGVFESLEDAKRARKLAERKYFDGEDVLLAKSSPPMRRNNSSGHVGVYWNKIYNVWSAGIKVAGRSYNLGRFTNIEDAIAARKAAELKYWGAPETEPQQ